MRRVIGSSSVERRREEESLEERTLLQTVGKERDCGNVFIIPNIYIKHDTIHHQIERWGKSRRKLRRRQRW